MSVVYAMRSENPPKSRPAMLPILIVLFLASYTILTMLVVEQGRTIEAQRGLLRDMLKDSSQLAQLRGKLAREAQPQAADKASAQPRTDETDHVATTRPNQPKSPAGSDVQKRSKAPHSMKEVPTKPAQDLQDARRSTSVI